MGAEGGHHLRLVVGEEGLRLVEEVEVLPAPEVEEVLVAAARAARVVGVRRTRGQVGVGVRRDRGEAEEGHRPLEVGGERCHMTAPPV